MSAREFLLAVEARYRALEKYADQGYVLSKARKFQQRCTFETTYQNDGTFSFKFQRSHPYHRLRHLVTRYEVGSEAGQAYFITQWPGSAPEREACESFNLAIAGATGISHGSALTIGSLLSDEFEGLQLKDLKRPRFRSMRMVDGTPCIAISAHHPAAGRKVLMCFGAHDMLLRALFKKFGARSEERRLIKDAVVTSTSSEPHGTAA